MTYDSVVAADTPDAWWKLADANGSSTAADSSGNGHAGTATSVTFGQSNTAVAGNTSASLNGTSSVVTTTYDPTASAVSCECWFNFNGGNGTGATNNPRLVSNDQANGGFTFLFSATAGSGAARLQIFQTSGTGSTTVSASGTIAFGDTTWHQAVFTYDGTTVLLYQDAVQVGSGSLSGSLTSGTNMALGRNGNSSTGFFNGFLAEVSVYTYKLTAAQVTAHYNAASAPPPAPFPPVSQAVKRAASY